MKGANTDPLAAISNPPINTIKKIMGANQSFLRTRKNAHNSLINSINHLKLIVERVTPWAR